MSNPEYTPADPARIAAILADNAEDEFWLAEAEKNVTPVQHLERNGR